MCFTAQCNVNYDDYIEVNSKLDEDNHLFVGVFEGIGPIGGRYREQSIYLTKDQIRLLINHLNTVLEE